MTQPNNPGYTPEYKELEKARERLRELYGVELSTDDADSKVIAGFVALLAAEVRVMRLERALEQ
jgi:hypothetical protein